MPADLGLGRFQFDFDREEDIAEVLKMEPFHFDHWMISLVRWEPRVEATYPSDITFWVRLMGVPLHFWAQLIFRTIGGAIGEVKEVDIDSGMVKVVINGKPLCFETSVEFHSGEEIPITLRYERLFGFCRKCFSLCHDEKECADLAEGGNGNEGPPGDAYMGSRMLSYKGAVDNKGNKPHDGGNAGPQGKQQGKRPVLRVMTTLRIADFRGSPDSTETKMEDGMEGKDLGPIRIMKRTKDKNEGM